MQGKSTLLVKFFSVENNTFLVIFNPLQEIWSLLTYYFIVQIYFTTNDQFFEFFFPGMQP